MADRIALIVANNDFEDERLRSLVAPSQDARALARVLGDEKIGSFETRLLINENADKIRRDIEKLYRRRKRDDLVLLYYSGHGIKDDFSDLFLAAQDTNVDAPSSTAIESAFVRRQLDKSGSQRKIIILDCCNSGAFSRGAKSAIGSSIGINEAFEGSGYGRVILTASNALEYAWEGDILHGEAQRSIFSEYLVKGLQSGDADLNRDGGVSVDELYEYVYEQHMRHGQTKQTPQKFAREVEGLIIIAKNPVAPDTAEAMPPWITSALSDETTSSHSRIEAIFQLIQLEKGTDAALASRARTLLEHIYETEQDPSINAAIAEALGKPEVTTHNQRKTSREPVGARALKVEQAAIERAAQDEVEHGKEESERTKIHRQVSLEMSDGQRVVSKKISEEEKNINSLTLTEKRKIDTEFWNSEPRLKRLLVLSWFGIIPFFGLIIGSFYFIFINEYFVSALDSNEDIVSIVYPSITLLISILIGSAFSIIFHFRPLSHMIWSRKAKYSDAKNALIWGYASIFLSILVAQAVNAILFF